MHRLLALFLTLTLSSAAFSATGENEALEFLTKKTIADFHQGVEEYNTQKAKETPAITKNEKGIYSFMVKKNVIEFTLVEYLKDQMKVNGKLTQRSLFGLDKTTWTNFLISESVAQDGLPKLDGESTRVILATLGNFSEKLEKIGMTCVFGCVKEIREKNLQKILKALDKKNDECSSGTDDQEESIGKFQRGLGTIIHSTITYEFQGVMDLFKKASAANQSVVNDFMDEKLKIGAEHKSCMAIMTVGTVADGKLGNLGRGWEVLRDGGPGTVQMQKAMEDAKNACIKMEQLKTCMLTVKKNVGLINDIKRAQKLGSPETLPSVPILNNGATK